ncbi:MAG: TIGR01621 family pseudouridine synthase [Pseudoalteromonas sp.]|uniref:TIGR01621 family pseudouridine synthase n=1 Tax=unclassified Pseudoalteromonas TaxID=194690 RepID=UPI003F9839A3
MTDYKELTVIASEPDYYVFNKPAGMSFHSEEGPGFVVIAEQQLNEKLYPVHRLDKVTSGLIILARNKSAASLFTSLFSDHQVSKFYLALSTQKPKKKQGWIKGDMAKSRRGSFKLLKSQENPAITRFYSFSVKENLRAFLLKPYSGKTHQLRVAMKSVSAPILGDVLYSGELHPRTCLHAFALRFRWQGEDMHYQLTHIDDAVFKSIFEHELFQGWQSPWQLDW